MSNHYPVVIIGAGPAGMAAAYEAVKQGICPIVLEQADQVGGLARTEIYKGYRFDIGGHRFYTKLAEVQQLWQTMLGEGFQQVPRLSRIYYRGHFYKYPLDLFDTLSNLGLVESLLISLSYAKAKLLPHPEEETFEQWVTNRFGRRLYQTFFQTYTEKVWGIPCREIQADWAAQRIKGLSVRSVLSNALFGTNNAKSLINEFYYPVLGPGMMWQRFQEAVENQGGRVWLEAEVVRLEREGGQITGIVVKHRGREHQVTGEHFVSTMPLQDLVNRLDPLPPGEVVQGGRELKYRDFILVGLIVKGAELLPDQWIYVHDPEARVGRIQNFKNWSAALVPDPHRTSLGMEYFCQENDDIWQLSDAELVKLATRELARLGLADAASVEDGTVIRQTKAYPVYSPGYRTHLADIRRFLATMDNLQTIGRNGMHRYNNQDHSMLTGMLAIRNLSGQDHDLWNANAEDTYYEEALTEP